MRGDNHMKDKIVTLFDCIKTLCESDIERIISFVLGIVSANQQPDRPACPHCGHAHVIKYGHTKEKQRFFCHGCRQTFLYSTGTLAYHSHFSRSIWADFIRDTLDGKTLDDSAEGLGFSHQTAFNMRHKVLMAFQDMLEKEPAILSGIAELDETFVLDCYKGKQLPEEVSRAARRHGAKAAKRGISSEYVAICTGIQRDGKAVAETVNRAKPSGKELCGIFSTHIAEDTLVLTDGLRSYKSLEASTGCTVVNVNTQKGKKVFNLNVVNSLHSYIKEMYVHYRGVATKYINRYNALFSIAFRCANSLADSLFHSLCNIGNGCFWHGVYDIHNYNLVVL